MSYYDKNSKQLRYRFKELYGGILFIGNEIAEKANFSTGDKLMLVKGIAKTFALKKNNGGYGTTLVKYSTKATVTPKYLRMYIKAPLLENLKFPKKEGILVFPHVVCTENPEEPYIKFWLSEKAAKE